MKKQFRQILVLSETSRAFGCDVLRGIQQFVQKQAQTDGAVPWRITFEDRGLTDELPVDFDSWKGDGILSRTVSQEMYKKLLKKKKPIVELLGDQISLFPEVCTDEEISASLAADHFRSRGLKYLGFYAYGTPWWVTIRRDLFVQQAQKMNMFCSVSPDCFGQTQAEAPYPRWKEGYRKSMFDWLRSLPKPIGIWCPADIQALKLAQACQELDISVPDQVAILGTGNDSLLCNMTTPNLSSLDINGEEVGFEAARLLEQRIQEFEKTGKRSSSVASNRLFTPIRIKPTGIVTRMSTDMIAIDNKECAKALKLIREHYHQDVSATWIASEVGVSRSTLDRIFRSLIGHSVEKEIYRLRIDLAEKLLRETDLSVNEVAAKTGFDRVEYFVRSFKKIFGDPPQKYRNRCKVK
ncbi:MAG: DNA-binding transcriptional regulator [Thermoguttaceae bacterium]|nr:DNA-binding transcriptional regulator [Thermoguttaceae bacterium]